MRVTTIAIKKIMKLFPAYPDINDYDLWEIFNHNNYLSGNDQYKKEIRYKSSQAAYEIEKNPKYQWLEKYFLPSVEVSDLEGARLLDLGCFTGGRLIAYIEKYNLAYGCGIDINPVFAQAGEEFAESKQLSDKASFLTGYGEKLPYENNSFDYLISTDVFEHVKDLKLVLSECHRILKPGGTMLSVFPQFYQPLEAHLGFVTSAIALHWLFPANRISEAYFEILAERGEDAKWYSGENQSLEPWEKLPHLNGTTVSKFRKLISHRDWQVEWKRRPILTDGRRAEELKFKVLSYLLRPLCKFPLLEELFLGRICVVATKKH
jgi:SAM-dependent methyltransferase